MLETVVPSTDVILRLAIGFAGCVIASLLALRLGALSKSGALAAVPAGTVAVGAGWAFALVLSGFFISSSALSRYRRRTKERTVEAIVAKGTARDAIQVLANGGVFALGCLWSIVDSNPLAPFCAAGAIAAAAADTWATEVGSLSESEPRSILSGRPVPAGTSGGITALGAAAGLAGAAFIGVLAVVGGLAGFFTACLVAGFAGAASDSLIGASLQSRRWCDQCQAHTERDIHPCGTRTTHVSGVRWIDNDVVNLLCTLVGATLAALWVL
ncbi:MAG: DUF92 domain-containing protein [Gemmatimonadaceae bacterium]|nr:DUF92 domain-containing protein [Gemmatimonadaceae bacterium]